MALLREIDFRPRGASWFRIGEAGNVGIVKPGDTVLYGGYDQKDATRIDISNGKVIDLPDALNHDKAHVTNMVAGAGHGSSGSGVFENTGALVGLIYSGYLDVGMQSRIHREIDRYYGDNIVNFYNTDAVVHFLQHESSYRPHLFSKIDPQELVRLDNVGHIFLSSVLVLCYAN
jgi:hypothetical protein